MNSEDRELGMGRAITRRDFVNGVAVTAGAAMALGQAGPALAEGPPPAAYPPVRSGLRGDHAASFPSAHALRDGAPPPEGQATGEVYDLVVVGAGLSGLAAAWYYRERAGTKARILILDNHDDFGGHAKRNEFMAGGRMLVAPGASNRIPSFDTWSHESSRLIRHLGVLAGDPRDRTDGKLCPSLGMGQASFFRKEVYGRDLLLRGATMEAPTPAFLAQAPVSAAVKADLWRLVSDPKVDYLPGLSPAEKVAKLRSMSYRDYLLQAVKVDPAVLRYTGGVWCMDNDTASAWNAYFRYKPGFAGLGVPRPEGSPESPERDETNYYLPGGNHSICRLMVRDLIPDALPPGDFIQAETERLDYATLDRPGQPTRIRLSSTVVRARHTGRAPWQFEPDDREVEITYVAADGQARTVMGKDVVMAGFNNMIPYICPELGDGQKAALHLAVRAVNVQTNVLLRNWEAFERLKVSSVAFPRTLFNTISLAAPRTFGALAPSTDPSQPILAAYDITHGLANQTFHEEMVGTLPPPGTPVRDQMRAARMGLFRTPYDHFERAIRSQSARALGAGGFDPGRDILAITVNRWGHGYALPTNALFDDQDAIPPYVTGRQTFGRIAIANSDASGIDTINAAFDQAARAVRDLEQNVSGRYGAI